MSYKVKIKEQRKIFDKDGFCNNRKKSVIIGKNGHALILAQDKIREEMHMMFVKETEPDNHWIYKVV